MSTYVLKDPLYNSEVSKITNFTNQWSKYFPYVKQTLYSYEFEESDVIITNIYKGNPYGDHKIPNKCKKIFIIHGIDGENVKYCEDADFIIYMNPFLKSIVEDVVGIKKPSVTAPRHPMFEFNTEVRIENFVYIGGWFFEDATKNLLDKLLELNKKVDVKESFRIYPIWGDIPTVFENIKKFHDELVNIGGKFGSRKIHILNEELFYDIMVHKTRIAKSAFLWDMGPSIEEVNDLLVTSNKDILKYHITESSMLSTFQSSDTKLYVDDKNIKFWPYFQKVDKFTYKDFSKIVREVVQNFSK